MHVVVVGAGAVGGYFGARLAASGTDVTFLVRERRFEQLQSRGLRVESPLGNLSLTPQLAASADEVKQPDVVLLAVKNYHLAGTLGALKALVTNGARVLPLQNGVNHIETLRGVLGQGAVLGGACFIEVTLSAEGDVVHGNQLQDIIFGRLRDAADAPGAPDGAWLEELEKTLANAGIGVTKSSDPIVDMWQKYIFLTALSGITAVTRQPIGVAVDDAVTNQFLLDLVGEMGHIARARGVALPDNAADAVSQRLASIPKTMTSSMHRDLEKGLPLELDSLQGAAREMAHDAGIFTPCLRSVYALLHPFKNGTAAANL